IRRGDRVHGLYWDASAGEPYYFERCMRREVAWQLPPSDDIPLHVSIPVKPDASVRAAASARVGRADAGCGAGRCGGGSGVVVVLVILGGALVVKSQHVVQ